MPRFSTLALFCVLALTLTAMILVAIDLGRADEEHRCIAHAIWSLQ